MRISDWSSDVCSSDLIPIAVDGNSGVALVARRLAVDLEVAALRRASGSETLGGDGPAVDSKAVTRPGHHEAASRLHADARSLDEISGRSEEHTSELQSLMRISYAVFCLKKKKESKH